MNRRAVTVVVGLLIVTYVAVQVLRAESTGPHVGPFLGLPTAGPRYHPSDAVRAPATIDGVTISIADLTTQPSAHLAGRRTVLHTAIASSMALTGVSVSVEVYSPTWSSVYAYRATLNLPAGSYKPLSATWAIPATQPAGSYHALVNVFSADWTTHYAESCCTDLFVVAAPNTIALGAWMPGAESDPGVVDQYAKLTGRMPAIVNYYQSWLSPDARNLNTGLLREYSRRGVTPMISWEPDVPDGKILDGSYDTFIQQYARDAAAYRKPTLLRFAGEENGNWNAWSPGVNGNTAETFVAAWRHIHDLFAAEHATNVQWVWAPNIEFEGSVPFASVYPGDAYVDWMGLDGYNWGPNGDIHTWISGYQLFGPSIESLMGLSSKPIMISEIGSTELGGNKPTWIVDWLLHDLPASFPRVRAVVWFDENKEEDWRVDSSPATLAAYRQVVASPVYQRRAP